MILVLANFCLGKGGNGSIINDMCVRVGGSGVVYEVWWKFMIYFIGCFVVGYLALSFILWIIGIILEGLFGED